MSYIAPNTVVKFIRNCPLESSYQNTLWFQNITSQTNYFNSIVKTPVSKYTLNAQSYQRASNGSIRVSLAYEDLVDCNYMMFNNQSFENKWFYAFITKVEYISNVVTQIYYSIDVMQTWFFDYTMRQCFVEREHTVTDNPGEHLVPEDLDIGDYILVQRNALDQPSNLEEPNKIVFVSSVDLGLVPVFEGTIIDGVYCPLKYITFDADTTGLTQANAFLSNLVVNNKIDSILSVFMAPSIIGSETPQNTSFGVSKRGYTRNPVYDNLNGYIPKNKKLFNAPYNIIHVYTDSMSIDFAYEYFTDSTVMSNNNVYFNTTYTLIPTPTVISYPENYRRESFIGVHNYEARIVLTDFPQCSISADIYKIWLAQNQAQLGVKSAFAKFDVVKGAWYGIGSGYDIGGKIGDAVGEAVGGAIGGLAGIIGGGLAGATAGAGTGGLIGGAIGQGAGEIIGAGVGGLLGAYDYSRDIQMLMAQHHDMSTKPPEIRGSQTSIADFSLGAKRIFADQMTIRADYAQRIDSYFDMFGYKVNVVKTPSIHNRPFWTYVKTVGCLIDGAMPADDETAICKIFDNGIRFWTTPNIMGDYSYNNSPTTPVESTT